MYFHAHTLLLSTGSHCRSAIVRRMRSAITSRSPLGVNRNIQETAVD